MALSYYPPTHLLGTIKAPVYFDMFITCHIVMHNKYQHNILKCILWAIYRFRLKVLLMNWHDEAKLFSMATSAQLSTAVALKLGYILITAGGTEETEETGETGEEKKYEKKKTKKTKKTETMTIKTRAAKTTEKKKNKRKMKAKTNMKSSTVAHSIRVFLTVSSEQLQVTYLQRHKVFAWWCWRATLSPKYLLTNNSSYSCLQTPAFTLFTSSVKYLHQCEHSPTRDRADF